MAQLIRTMVYHNITASQARNGVVLLRLAVTQPKTQVADNNIVGINAHRIVTDTNTDRREQTAPQRLHYRTRATQYQLQRDRAGYRKYDNTRSALLQRLAQAPGAVIVKISYNNYLAATATRCILPEALQPQGMQ